MAQNPSEEILDIAKKLGSVRRGREQAIRYWQQELDQIRSQVEDKEWYKMVRNYEHDMSFVKEPIMFIWPAVGVGGDAVAIYDLVTKGTVGMPFVVQLWVAIGNFAILGLLCTYRRARKTRNAFISKYGKEAFGWAREIYKSLR